MKAYIISFILILLFTYVAEKKINKNKNKEGCFFLIISLLILVLIAGLRTRFVGVDSSNYPLAIYQLAVEGKTYMQIIQITKVEPLFVLIIYISSIFKNYNVTMGFVEFFCALPIYIYAFKNKENNSITFTIFIFLTTMYAKSFNLQRQFIAISLLILAIYYYKQKQPKKAFCLYIIAIMFHYTAIIGILIIVLNKIFLFYEDKFNKKLWIIFLTGIIVGIAVLMNKIIYFLPTKYAEYGNLNNESGFTIMGLAKKIFWITMSIMIVSKSKDNSKNRSNAINIMLLFIDLIFYFIGIKISIFGRLGYYFLYLAYFDMIPKIPKIFRQKVFVKFLLIIIMLFLWFNMTVINFEADKSYPYMSEIMPILNDKSTNIKNNGGRLE